jgi:DNA-binding HxlR family transcriptional regulator
MEHQMAPSPSPVKKAREAHQVSPAKPAPNPYTADCPTRMALDRIADKWTVLLLGLIDERPLRFNQLRRAVEGLSQKMLSQTLKALERDGLVTRTAIATVPVTVEYSITPLGRTLALALAPLTLWASEHIGEVLRARERYDLRDAAKAARFDQRTPIRIGA